MSSPTSIAIIGMAGRFPGAQNIDEFWHNLRQGKETIERFTTQELIDAGVPESVATAPNFVPAKGILNDIAGFDAPFFGFSPREASYIDPQQRIFMECAWQALEHAGYDPLSAKTLIGLYAGCGDSTYLHHLLQSHTHLGEAAKEPSLFFGNFRDFFATRVSYRLNLKGPSINIQTACSTSLVAIHSACSALLAYQCDIALAGGIHVSVPHKGGNFHETGGVVSPDGHCRAFDAQAAGTVQSDGVGIVVLKRLEEALEDGDTIHAVILGSAVNNDGAEKIGYTAPSVAGQTDVITMAQEMAGVDPADISYVEAHGTGTKLGDPIEIQALTHAFRRSTAESGYCAIGSLKTNVGHLDAAAGVAGLIKTVLALKHEEIPASLHFKSPNPAIEFEKTPFFVNDRLRAWQPRANQRIAAVSSFGIGGTNAHLIVGQASAPPASSATAQPELLVLSAKTPSAVLARAKQLREHLHAHAKVSLADVAYTLALGRHPFEYRLSLVAKDVGQAREALDQSLSITQTPTARQQLAFLFPGQGLQCIGMGGALYKHAPLFRQTFDEGAAIAAAHLDSLDLTALLFDSASDDAHATLLQTRYAQPALFLVEYALARYLASLQIRPDVMLGHSIGEWVAACLAGVFSFEDAVKLVCQRGALMQDCEPGGMLGVELSESALLPLLQEGQEISVYNAENWLIVSGAQAGIDELRTSLSQRGIRHHDLRVSHAFHSAWMQPAANRLATCFEGVALSPPQQPFISNVTGTWITDDQACNPQYWAKQLRQPVRFDLGVATLRAQSDLVCLEVGPGGALRLFASLGGANDVISTWPDPKGDARDQTLAAIGQLWQAGLAPDFGRLYDEPRRRVALPTYPFEHQPYWIETEPLERSAPRLQAPAQDTPQAQLAAPRKDPDLANWFFVPQWQVKPLNQTPTSQRHVLNTLWILGPDVPFDPKQIGPAAHTRVVRAGETFREVHAHEFTLSLTSRSHYEALFETLTASGWHPDRIIHASNLDQVSHEAPDAQRALQRYLALLSLAQATNKQLHNREIALIVLANELLSVGQDDRIQPDKATVMGPAKVMALEYPNLTCRVLDLDAASLANPDLISLEIEKGQTDRLVAYRNGQRHVESYARKRLPDDPRPPRLKHQGHYLITGGLGGVGLALAEHLVRQAQARVTLVSRTKLPPRAQWPAVIADVGLPDLTQQHDHLADAVVQSSGHHAIAAIDDHPGLAHALGALSEACIQRYLYTAMGQPGTLSIDTLKGRLKLAARFERMFAFMLDVIRDCSNSKVTDTEVTIDAEPIVARAELCRQFPAFRGLIEFIDDCTRAYPQALSGEIAAIEVLYPEGKTDRLERMQRDTVEHSQQPVYRQVLCDLLHGLSKDRALRVLEVGGGQGLLTRELAPTLLANGSSYHFTDISAFFIERAKTTFADLGQMTTGLFDISRDPAAQGLAAGSFDVIVGLDVVHATADITATLSNLRQLLAPGGYVALLETVRTGPWVDLCWGLADGWWLYQDHDLRQSVLMDPAQWHKAVKKSGFEQSLTLPTDPGLRQRSDVCLVLAQQAADGGALALPDWQAQSSQDPRVLNRYRIEKLLALEALGGQVDVIAADIGNPEDVTNMVAKAREHFGPISGVIHAAMVLEDKLMQLKDADSARRVFGPKVHGSLLLEAALASESLDFFVHCSSLAAPMGLYAQSDYCAATSFQDALVHANRRPGYQSMNWGVWRDAGFAMRMKLAGAAHHLHWQALPGPLLRRQTKDRSNRWVFEGDLSGQWPMLEHQLDGVQTWPGTAYLSLIDEAARALGMPSYVVDSLAFSAPLTQTAKQPGAVRLRLTPSGEHFEFTIASPRGERWIEHARGQIAQQTSEASQHDLSALEAAFDLKAMAPSRQSASGSAYERRVQIEGRWQSIAIAQQQQANQALAVLVLDDAYEDDLGRYRLHPALLDIATSFALTDQAFYLPLAYEKCHVYQGLSKRIWAHIRWSQNADSGAPVISFEVCLFNDDGQCALHLENYTLRRAEQSTQQTAFRRLVCQSPGLLDSLVYVTQDHRRALLENEIEVSVAATGLNFLDVLSALGMLELADNGSSIGHECAGVITRVGANVHDFKRGDDVIAVASDAYDDLVCVDRINVRAKPAQMSWAVAASFAVPFMTAHYALHHRAQLRAGETVLIHAAAGGVGLAAVQLAQNAGATIYATAGSAAKRDYLKNLGIEHVFDSRSNEFARQIRQISPRGVDVVLNCLGGELMLASLELLAPHGRFLELGKRDFAENRALGMQVLGNGVSYFAINLGPQLALYPVVFDEVLEMFQASLITPLPLTQYPVEDTAQAFGDMARAKHIGKLVITRTPASVKSYTEIEFDDIDAPLQDPQLREGMSSLEGAQAFDRALSCDEPQVLVTPQDFLALLKHNSPEVVRQQKTVAAKPAVNEPTTKVTPASPQPQTAVADVVRQSWIKHLGVQDVAPEDNFFSLGGDSLIGIQIMAYLRKELGIEIPMAIFFEAPTLQELTDALQSMASAKVTDTDTESPLAFRVDPQARFEPFALTDVQQAYWIGRSTSFELGNVSAHGYFEVERDELDYERFCDVWMQLVMRHDMLRMIVTDDGQQRVLPSVKAYRPPIIDLRTCQSDEVQASIQATRQQMATQVLPSDQWPLFDIRISQLPGGVSRIHMSFDALIMDAWSSMILGREFALLYANPQHHLPELEIQFRDYVLHEQAIQETATFEASKAYWLDRLQTLPPAPELPLAISPERLQKPSFSRREARLDAAQWSRIKQLAQSAGLTPSAVCLTCFGDVLARWSQSSHFTVNLTLFNRPEIHPQVKDLVGDFTSLTLLEMNADAALPFIERAQRVQRQLARDIDHRHFSGVRVLRELVRSGQRDSGAIMPVVFTSTLALDSQQQQHSPVIFDGRLVYGLSQTPQVWLDHGILEENGELVLNWNAVDDLFAPNMLDDMFTAYQDALAKLSQATDWQMPVRLNLPKRQSAMRAAFNETKETFELQRLEAGFFEQARKHPTTVAIAMHGSHMTYETLASHALGVSDLLRKSGVSSGACVGVHLPKGWQQIAAVLGILRAGCTYVPLDPALPTSRLGDMSQAMQWAITTESLSTHLPDSLRAVFLHEVTPTDLDTQAPQSLEALAYIIYTSGSTGKPKGVMIEHKAAMNTIADLVNRFGLCHKDSVLALSALGFDLSVFDAFATLGIGAKVVMPEEQGLREPDHWHALLTEHEVTVWNSVPALMELLVDYVEQNQLSLPASLRLIMLSGDWIPTDLPARIAKLLPEAALISLGGATEASIWSIYYPIESVSCDWQSIPYGYPLANQTYRVLDGHFADCPEWVTGELYIGGVGLAAGYWQDPTQTEQRFITIEGQRYYRTGDLGRFRPEGWIEFQGRNDNQVKIQGYRIEIAEIETVLRQHPAVAKSAVKVVQSAAGSRQLAGYVVAAEGQVAPSSEQLRAFLAQRLPHYMVPVGVMCLEALPLSRNGKVDYASLPAIEEPVRTVTSAHAAQTPNQHQVLEIVADVLGLAAVDASQNLLDLGVDSIGMIRIANRMQSSLGVRPNVGHMYRMKAISELVALCGQTTVTTATPAVPAEQHSLAPLITDPAQRAAFKATQTAIRSFPANQVSVALDPVNDSAQLKARKSQRQFALAPISLASVSAWLGALRQEQLDGEMKYLYASAGGLYPVQTYIYIKAGRVQGLGAGFYYYDPLAHRLVLVSSEPVVKREHFDPIINQPIYDQAAFCVYFIASLARIEPIYGEHSQRFVDIEAGLMAQCLDFAALEQDLGLCHIGEVWAEDVLALIPAADKPRWVLSLLGGRPVSPSGDQAQDTVSQLLAKVSELTPEQVRDMLAAKRGGKP